jgi:hypothetical protein
MAVTATIPAAAMAQPFVFRWFCWSPKNPSFSPLFSDEIVFPAKVSVANTGQQGKKTIHTP